MDEQGAVDITEDPELRRLEDESINEIVKLQLDMGYHAVNDGEYRRHQFWGTFFPGLEGFEEIQNPPLDMFRLYVPDLAAFSQSYSSPLREPKYLTSAQPRRATSLASLSSAPERSSTKAAPIFANGST